jgi:hypothetical protein
VINGRPTFHESGIGMTNAGADQVAVLDTLLVNASSDARMGTFYQIYYCYWPQMKTAGIGLANHFNDIFDWGKFGHGAFPGLFAATTARLRHKAAIQSIPVQSLTSRPIPARGIRRQRGPRKPASEWCNDAISDCDCGAVPDRPRVVHAAIMLAWRVRLVSGQ